MVQWLRKAGVGEPAAWLIEAFEPLAILGAQAMYILAPLFPSQHNLIGLAGMLEDPDRRATLVDHLQDPSEEA
jgi:hypothetical protein